MNLGILIFPDVEELDFVGPWEMAGIWTSAGVSAGIDLMLAFIADIAGEETAGKVQFAAEYYPSVRRYGASHQSPMAPGYLKGMV